MVIDITSSYCTSQVIQRVLDDELLPGTGSGNEELATSVFPVDQPMDENPVFYLVPVETNGAPPCYRLVVGDSSNALANATLTLVSAEAQMHELSTAPVAPEENFPPDASCADVDDKVLRKREKNREAARKYVLHWYKVD